MARVKKSKEVVKYPEPSEAERTAMAASKERLKARTPRPDMKASYENRVLRMEAAHSAQRDQAWQVMEALGSTSNDWVTQSALKLVSQARDRGGDPTTPQLNSVLAFMSAIAPGDELEAALGMQMFATHDLTIEMSLRAKHADNRQAIQEYVNLATKTARTFTTQVEALAKLRRGGEQVVRHVYVDNRGGQAVISETVNTGGAGNGKSVEQPHAPGGEAPGFTALPGPDSLGQSMPGTGDAERPVQDARRQEHRRTG